MQCTSTEMCSPSEAASCVRSGPEYKYKIRLPAPRLRICSKSKDWPLKVTGVQMDGAATAEGDGGGEGTTTNRRGVEVGTESGAVNRILKVVGAESVKCSEKVLPLG